MNKCLICLKNSLKGNIVSHSHRETKHFRKPNLQKTTVNISGNKCSLTVCAKCLKNLHKN